MIKIAFFDVDGTILKSGHRELSEKTVWILNRLRQEGVILCMATGRGYPCVPDFNNMKFDIYLTYTGSFVTDGMNVMRNNPLHKRDAKQIIRNLIEMGKSFTVGCRDLLYVYGQDPYSGAYPYAHKESLTVERLSLLEKIDIYQIMCRCEKEEHGVILKDTSYARISAWCDSAIDIIPLYGGKAAAVEDVLKYYGFAVDEAFAFGDSRNDMDMLKAVGTGIAMGNAENDVKKIADEICGSVDDDGVYHYFIENISF